MQRTLIKNIQQSLSVLEAYVHDFDFPWQSILISMFQHCANSSDESGRGHVAQESEFPIVLLLRRSVSGQQSCVFQYEAESFHILWNKTLHQSFYA